MGSETELRVKVQELLVDDAYLSKVVDDKKSWFTRMQVLDPIYQQFFLTANSLGCQLTTSQYFQPLAPQTLALAATAIHCALSKYTSGKSATLMISQDEYRGIFGPSPVINFTLEATIQSITHQRPSTPPPPPPEEQLHYNSCSSILVGAAQPRFDLFYFIPQSIPPLSSPLSCSTL